MTDHARSPLDDVTPDTCPGGHDLRPVKAAHAALVEHVNGLNLAQVIGDLACLAPTLFARIEPNLPSDGTDLGLRVFMQLVTRLDSDAPLTVDGVPPSACTCHPDGQEVPAGTSAAGTVGLINAVMDELRAHAHAHEHDGPTAGNYL